MNSSNDNFDASVDHALKSSIEEAVKLKFKDVINHAVHEIVDNEPTMVHAIKQDMSFKLSNAIRIEVEARVEKRLERTLTPSITKIVLEAKLKMANDMLTTKVAIIEAIEAHVKRRSGHFQEFEAFLEDACFDGGEDSLGAGGPLTNLLNFAHGMNGEDEKAFEKTIEELQNGLVSKEFIGQMEVDLAQMGPKEDGAAN